MRARRCPRRRRARGAGRSPAAEKARPAIQTRAGQWSSALLQCSDSYGNPRPAITAIATGLELSLTDTPDAEGDGEGSAMMKLKLRSEQRLNADGSIWLRYAPLAAGSQFLSVKLNGVHVLGSPLKLDVHAGLMQIHCCEVTGDGASLCHLNERASFRIRAKDGYNNQQPRGGEKFHVALTRADAPAAPPVHPSVRDDNDGSYLVEYTLAKVGMWRLDVRHGDADGEPLASEPTPLECLPGSAHLPSCRFVSAQHGTRVLSAVDSADDDELHPTPGAAPYLGHVPACGSKLRVLVRLVDKAGSVTRLSTPRQVQLALVPDREAFDAARAAESDGAPSEGVGGGAGGHKTYEQTVSAWVAQQLRAQRLAERSAAGGAGGAPRARARQPSVADQGRGGCVRAERGAERGRRGAACARRGRGRGERRGRQLRRRRRSL